MEPQEITFFATVARGVYMKRRADGLDGLAKDGWKIFGFTGTAATGKIHEAGLVLGRGDSIVIAFRGTEISHDFVTDARAILTSAEPLGLLGSVHKGFFNAFTSSWPEIKEIIGDYARSNGLAMSELEFFTTGHSLGAALATLAAAQLKTDSFFKLENTNNNKSNQIKSFTFGSPRLFSKKAAKKVDSIIGIKNIARFAIVGDPVPLIPDPVMGYRHIGTYIQIASTKETAGPFHNILPASSSLPSLKAHQSLNYLLLAKDAFKDFQKNPSTHNKAITKNLIHDLAKPFDPKEIFLQLLNNQAAHLEN